MNLRLIREPSRYNATLGVLFVDGVFHSFTVEDVIREVAAQPVSKWKVPGETAIPAGRYRVQITHSPRFGRRLPILLNVPGFDGIRIHPGNSAADSEGCILPGRARAKGMVLESRSAFDELFALLNMATDDIWIGIENPLA